MSITLAKARKMVKTMIKLKVKPIEFYILMVGDKTIMLPVSESIKTMEATKIKFPIKPKYPDDTPWLPSGGPFEIKMEFLPKKQA